MSVFTVGHATVGSASVAGSVYHDPPTVAVTAPATTLVDGNVNAPVVTVAWDYFQAQGDVQEEYRVLFYDTGTAAVYYDSGWLSGAVATHDVDLDANDLPHDLATYAVTVGVRSWGAVWEVTSAEQTWAVQWGTPSCTITAPTGGYVKTDEDPLTVSWTFSDLRGGVIQEQYRVRILSKETGAVLYTTGWVTSTALTTDITYTFSDNSSYYIEVQLKNNNGIRSD